MGRQRTAHLVQSSLIKACGPHDSMHSVIDAVAQRAHHGIG